MIVLHCATGRAFAEAESLSRSIADSILREGSDPSRALPADGEWSAALGWQIDGLNAAWYNTAQGAYFRFGEARADMLLARTSDGATLASPADPVAADLLGHELVLLARVTLAPKYFNAATALWRQLAPRCGLAPAPSSEIHPSSSCRAEPFLAEYASAFQRPEDFSAVARSFAERSRAIAGQSHEQDHEIALFAADLVDALAYFPDDAPERAAAIKMLKEAAMRLVNEQHQAAGMNAASQRQNLPGACLAIYVLAKGARLGYLPVSDSVVAQRRWRSIVRETGWSVASAPALQRMPAGGQDDVGPFLLAATEMDLAQTAMLGRGQAVLLDAWYNSQERKNPAGQMESFHYKWTDQSDSGYSLLAHTFHSFGISTRTLFAAPTRDNLRAAQFYIIVSPDIPVKNPKPHYMNDKDAAEVVDWVNDGGVLILMENDPPNADIDHLNLLADKFGIHFDNVLHHHIFGEHVDDGRIPVTPDGRLFHRPHILYMKDTCAISLHNPAEALLRDRGDIVMATAHYGRGTVLAIVDPWLYNEYTDGRKNPQIYGQFDNFAAGKELLRWLIEQHSPQLHKTKERGVSPQ